MNEKLRSYIDKLFDDAPKTRKALELKEELLANSEERYQDLIENGIAQEDAIRNVISSLGNVSELFQGLEETSDKEQEDYHAYVKKSAVIKTVAAGIYIFSFVVLLFFVFLDKLSNTPMTSITGMLEYSYFDFIMLGFVIAFFIDIVPTCMLVYITSIAPKYKKQGDTLVENFKEWQSNSKQMKSIIGAASAVLWTVAVLVYFAISIATYAWYATWIVFLVAICLQTIVILFFRLKQVD